MHRENSTLSPMRVAMLSTEADRCGIASYTNTLGGGLEAAGVEVVRVSLDAARRVKATFVDDVRRDIERARPDVVHVQHEYSFFGGLIQPPAPHAALLMRALQRLRVPDLEPSRYFEMMAQVTVPRVVTLHEYIEAAPAPELGVRRGIERALVRETNRATFAGADAVVTHSDERKARLVEIGVEGARVHVIPLAIPGAPALPERSAARDRLGLKHEVVLLAAGFLSPRKGVDHLVRALALLPPRAVLVVVGADQGSDGGGCREDLARLAVARGVEARVRFTGYLASEALADWLAAADVYALTPRDMGGASASLAMGISACLPIVAWAHPSMSALAAQHGCIELVPFHDEAALVRTIAHLIEEPDALAELRARSELARVAGSPEVEGRRTREVYERLLNARSWKERRRPPVVRMTTERVMRACVGALVLASIANTRR